MTENKLRSAQMVKGEKSEKKFRIYHHHTTIPFTSMASVFLYRRSAYSLPLQILFLQFERLKLLTIAFPIRIRILNLQYFYVFEFKIGSSSYLIFQGSSFTLFFKKIRWFDSLSLDALVPNYPSISFLVVTLGILPLIYFG